MTAIVVVMGLIVVIALVVITSSSAEEEDDWSVKRPGRKDPEESGLDDLLG